MVVELRLVPETEARLRERAVAAGKDPAVLVGEAVEEKFGSSRSFREILAPVHEEVRASGMSEQELDQLLAETLGQARQQRREARHGG